MKAVIIFLIFILANTLHYCAKNAVVALANDPLLWSDYVGYLFWFVVGMVSLIAYGRKFLAK